MDSEASIVNACCDLLDQTVNNIKEDYDNYVKYKLNLSESYRNFSEYVYMCAIKKINFFAFKHKVLAFKIMSNGESIAKISNVKKYLKLMKPLVSYWDVDYITNIIGDELKQNVFEKYVTELQQIYECESTWPDWRVSFKFVPEEKMILLRNEVVDYSNTIPYAGRIGLTSTSIIFESGLVRKQRIIPIDKIRKIDIGSKELLRSERLIITFHNDENTLEKVQWSFSGMEEKQLSNELNIWSCIFNIRVTLNEILQQENLSVRHSILLENEVNDNLKRIYAVSLVPELYKKLNDANDLAILKTDNVLSENNKKLLTNMRELLKQIHNARVKAEGDFMHHIKNAIKGKFHKLGDLDPETPLYLLVNDQSTESQVVDEFNLNTFVAVIKQLKVEFAPFTLGFEWINSILDWEEPFTSAITLWFLLTLAYYDRLSYLPGLLIGVHTVLLFYLKKQFVKDFDLQEQEEMPQLSSRSRLQSNDDDNNVGYLDRILRLRDAVTSTVAGLTTVQRGIQAINVKLMKFKGFYWWTFPPSSQGYMFMSFILSIIFLLVPFRIIFCAVIISLFTKKYRPEPNYIEILMDEVPYVPVKMLD